MQAHAQHCLQRCCVLMAATGTCLPEELHFMLEHVRDALHTRLDLIGPFALKVVVNRLREELQPAAEVLPPDGKTDVFLKGIAAITLLPEHHRCPEVVHDGQVSGPGDVIELGCLRRIHSNVAVSQYI